MFAIRVRSIAIHSGWFWVGENPSGTPAVALRPNALAPFHSKSPITMPVPSTLESVVPFVFNLMSSLKKTRVSASSAPGVMAIPM